MLSWLCLVVYVGFVTRVPHHVRCVRFLLRLCEAGHVLQPKGGEHVHLSSRRSIDPQGPASSRGMAFAETLGSYDTGSFQTSSSGCLPR